MMNKKAQSQATVECEKYTTNFLPRLPPVLHSFVWISLFLLVNSECPMWDQSTVLSLFLFFFFFPPKCYSLGEIFIFLRNQSLKLREPTVYVELVERVCSGLTPCWHLVGLGVFPGELSQSMTNLYQILGRCEPALHKGLAATLLPRCVTPTTSPCRAGRAAWVSIESPEAFLGLRGWGWFAFQW